MKMPSSSFRLVSKCSVFPCQKSTTPDLKLSVSDLPMLSCHYIQKGCLYIHPPFPIGDLIAQIKKSLSTTLTHFPPLAGRLVTDSNGYIYIKCNDAGVDFLHVTENRHVSVMDILSQDHVPEIVKGFFTFDQTVSYDGHTMPILAVQVTELVDGVFIGCSVNHAVSDGTSFWNFFNTFAEINRGLNVISKQPVFGRDSVLISPAVLRVPQGGPIVTFDVKAEIKERIFSFSREDILKLKAKVNSNKWVINNGEINIVELMGKQCNDPFNFSEEKLTPLRSKNMSVVSMSTADISSFQSLSALLWRGITRARKFPDSKTTTFRMAVNCRHRLEPKLEPLYFGNAIQSIPTYAQAGDVLNNDLRWCAEQLNKNVSAYDNKKVRSYIETWEQDPRCFPLGNFDGAMITMGSSPRFPMYDNDFGWGRPVAVRSGRANKFDGKISAFPGREGAGSVDLEVVLAPATMAGLESDPEFMQFVTRY
ncbi:hypothetical protein Leryth_021978 [Lithospermum erythrorhizon]|uniref:Uncharacterized protein n=1 Tax=Lithospermum erythrorhizon TaxID=34254 RepID=A0AAV3PSD3_LITER|nr:hypothetical protein Leryth_021978 [Lithospermum erythrorhizon]